MITEETATRIAFAYREIKAAEALLEKVGKVMDRFRDVDIRDVFGHRTDGLSLGIPTSETGKTLFNVPYSICGPIIEAHIAHHRVKIAALCEIAKAELAGQATQGEVAS